MAHCLGGPFIKPGSNDPCVNDLVTPNELMLCVVVMILVAMVENDILATCTRNKCQKHMQSNKLVSGYYFLSEHTLCNVIYMIK